MDLLAPALAATDMAASPDGGRLQSVRQIACTYFEQFGLKTAHNLELPRGGSSARLAAPKASEVLKPSPMRARTAFDLIFRNARTRSSATPVDIGVSGGRIAAIEPRLACDAPEIDVGGKL